MSLQRQNIQYVVIGEVAAVFYGVPRATFDLDIHTIVLGSAVYAGMWLKKAAAFLEANEKMLAERAVWLFSSGPTGEGDPVQLMKGWKFPETQQPIADRIGPRDIAFFHGEIDLKDLNLAEKLIVKGIKAPTGDFRDWEAITAWATAIGKTLKREAG